MSKQNSSFSLGNGGSNFQSSSQAAFQNPSQSSSKQGGKQNPPNLQASSFSLGQDNGGYESEAKYQQNHGIKASSSSASEYPTPGQRRSSNDSSFSVGNSKESNFVTSSSSYGVAGQGQGNNPGNYGRHGAPGARNTSSDSLISNNQPSSNFVTSNAAAFPPKPSSSSSNSNPPPQSNFRSSNASYGSGASDNITQSPKHSFRGAGGGRQESSDFQIGCSSDNSYATSTSAAYSRPGNSNQGGGPPQAVGTRQVTEQHKGLQRSSFNPITGEPQ